MGNCVPWGHNPQCFAFKNVLHGYWSVNLSPGWPLSGLRYRAFKPNALPFCSIGSGLKAGFDKNHNDEEWSCRSLWVHFFLPSFCPFLPLSVERSYSEVTGESKGSNLPVKNNSYKHEWQPWRWSTNRNNEQISAAIGKNPVRMNDAPETKKGKKIKEEEEQQQNKPLLGCHTFTDFAFKTIEKVCPWLINFI